MLLKLDIYQMLFVQFWAPDDGRRNRLKRVQHWILYNVASGWLYLKESINDARSREHKNYLKNAWQLRLHFPIRNNSLLFN
jgi:hypothetical protein